MSCRFVPVVEVNRLAASSRPCRLSWYSVEGKTPPPGSLNTGKSRLYPMPAQIADCHLWAFQHIGSLRIPAKARPGKSPFFRVFKFGAFCVAVCVVEVNGSGDPLCLSCQLLTLRPFAPIVRCGYLFDWFDKFRGETPEKRAKLFDQFEFAAVGRSCVDEEDRNLIPPLTPGGWTILCTSAK